MQELAFVQAGLLDAAAGTDEGFSISQIHRNRSRRFVEAVATRFRRHFRAHSLIRVLSKHCADNRSEFGLNELLYDILVCEVGTVPAVGGAAQLAFVARALWQIESEFAADTREALFDFNKLVLGAAPLKLFIGPQTSDDEAFLRTLLPAANACAGDVYAALVPHPADWLNKPLSVRTWLASKKSWVELPTMAPEVAV